RGGGRGAGGVAPPPPPRPPRGGAGPLPATPEMRPADLATCPRCRLEFSPSAPVEVTGPSGTVSMAPEDPPASPTPPSPTAVPVRVGRFEVRRYLGEGSFGRVYEAHDPTLRRTVALKVAKAEQL